MIGTDSEQWEARLAAAGLTLRPATRQAPPEVPRPAWPIRLLAGIGGFIGGIMILLFLGLGLANLNLFNSPGAASLIGMALCGGAVAAYRVGAGSAAVEQGGLAISIAGQMALGFGVAQWFDHHSRPLLWPLVLVQIAMLLLVNNGLHRTLVAAGMVLLGTLSCRGMGDAALWWGLVAFGVVFLLWGEGHGVVRGWVDFVSPVVFGATGGLIASQFAWTSGVGRALELPASGPLWATTLPALGLAVMWASDGLDSRRRAGVVLLAMAAGLMGLWLPGWTPALLLAVLGLAWARPAWAVVAVAAMVGAVSQYYYNLRLTLLEKAAWMAAAGLACLVLAALVHWLAPRLAPAHPPSEKP